MNSLTVKNSLSVLVSKVSENSGNKSLRLANVASIENVITLN